MQRYTHIVDSDCDFCQIKATYDQFLVCLSGLVRWSRDTSSLRRDLYDTSSRRPPSVSARASLHRTALKDMAMLAHEGITRVAYAQGASEGSNSRSSGSLPRREQMGPQRKTLDVSRDHHREAYESGDYRGAHNRQNQRSDYHDQLRPSDPYHGYLEASTVSTSTSNDIRSAPYGLVPTGKHESRLAKDSTTASQCSIGCNAMLPSDNPSQLFMPSEAVTSSTGTQVGSPVRCLNCDKRETPEWRKGPYGPRTLCNACVSALSFCVS